MAISTSVIFPQGIRVEWRGAFNPDFSGVGSSTRVLLAAVRDLRLFDFVALTIFLATGMGATGISS